MQFTTSLSYLFYFWSRLLVSVRLRCCCHSISRSSSSCPPERSAALQPRRIRSAPKALPAKGTLTLSQQTETFLLPPLPCSSLCLCPLNFSHCWQTPALELQKSAGGAFLQSCRLPVPVWMPYIFTPPEQPTCIIVHILSLPSSALNKKGKILFEKRCRARVFHQKRKKNQQSRANCKHKQDTANKEVRHNNPGSFTRLEWWVGASLCPWSTPPYQYPPRALWETIQLLCYLITAMETKETQVSQALISNRFPPAAQAPTFAAAATCAFVSHPIPQEPRKHPETRPRAR